MKKYLLLAAALCVLGCQDPATMGGIPSFDSYREKAKAAAEKAEQAVQLTAEGRRIKDRHPDWSKSTCNAIAAKEISIGMTADQVKASWGAPYKINSTVNAGGNYEQWVMSERRDSDYLYFENGVLRSMQRTQ